MNMETQQENQQSGDQLERRTSEADLNLKHSARDQLITTLTDLSAVLQCNEPISKDAKERIRKEIDESIRLLVGLSRFELTEANGASAVLEEIVSDQLILGLSKAKRLKVIGHLTAIRDAVQFDVSTTDETKRSLATDNKQIINQLTELANKENGSESDELLLNQQMGRQPL